MLSSAIRTDLVLLDMKSRDKLSALKELLDIFKETDHSYLRIGLLQNLLHRENLESTIVGNGIAMPHCRTTLVNSPTVILGYSKDGIDFGSDDDQPIHVIILVLVPQVSTVPWLELIRDIVMVARNDGFVDMVGAAQTPQELIAAIRYLEEKANNELSLINRRSPGNCMTAR